jgi:hypothetical protein
MKGTRRRFLKTLAVSSMVPPLFDGAKASTISSSKVNSRRFRFVQIDVFTSQRLEGNPLSVFTDARGLSDSKMQSLARETNLQETTFVLPRDSAVEEREGVQVRIFTPDEEIPFGGHPTLGTATVLRTLRLASGTVKANDASASTIVLDLKVGKVPVSFREDADGLFGEMRQVLPIFGLVHDRNAVADALGLDAAEIEPDLPIQTVSTGLPFANGRRHRESESRLQRFPHALERRRPRHPRPEASQSRVRQAAIGAFRYLRRLRETPFLTSVDSFVLSGSCPFGRRVRQPRRSTAKIRLVRVSDRPILARQKKRTRMGYLLRILLIGRSRGWRCRDL